MSFVVPKDLLDDIARAPGRSKRLLVTAWVFSRGRDDKGAFYRARDFWPPDLLESIERVSVLGVLMRLQLWGVVTEIDELADFFTVEVSEKEVT